MPVSMVENLLIDPEIIFKAIATVTHKTSFNSSDDVAVAVDAIIDEMLEHEVSRRIKAAVPARTFRLADPVADARRQVEEFSASILGTLSVERLAILQGEAKKTVDSLKAAAKRRELFDGKKVLNEFYKRHIHITGMSKEIFIYSCAREASSRQSVAIFIEALFATLKQAGPQAAAPSQLT